MGGFVGYVKEKGTGVTLAKVFAETRERVEDEIEHYAWQYAEEGPITTSIRKCPERRMSK